MCRIIGPIQIKPVLSPADSGFSESVLFGPFPVFLVFFDLEAGFFKSSDIRFIMLYKIGDSVVKEIEITRIAGGFGCRVEDNSPCEVTDLGAVISEDCEDFGLERS